MSGNVLNILSTENELFRTYVFYCCILVIKMLLMGPLTTRQRMKHKAFASPEDTAAYTNKLKPKVEEDVERVRRAHLNDLENIPIFFVAGFAYILTNPAVGTATLLFRIFTAARILHTVVYAVVVIPQPARAISYTAGLLITIYMAMQGVIHFM